MKKRRVIVISGIGALIALWGVVELSFVTRRVRSMNCLHQMVQLRAAALEYADVFEKGLRFPMDFRCLLSPGLMLDSDSNYFICPGDNIRTPAKSRLEFDADKNCSYEIVTPGLSTKDTDTVYFRCKVHGHLGYGDDVVSNGVRRRTKE